jgi:hypothetical protein
MVQMMTRVDRPMVISVGRHERNGTGQVTWTPILSGKRYTGGSTSIGSELAADLDTSQIVVGTQMPDGAAAKPRQQT